MSNPVTLTKDDTGGYLILRKSDVGFSTTEATEIKVRNVGAGAQIEIHLEEFHKSRTHQHLRSISLTQEQAIQLAQALIVERER